MAEEVKNFPGAHSYSFKTKRLLLRPVHVDDVEAVFALRSDPKVFYWTQPNTHISEARDWIDARLKSSCYLSFCIEELPETRDDGTKNEISQVIGLIGGTVLPEIGYMLRPAVWGRGYAQEALRGFLKFYWETFPQGHPVIPNAEDRTYLMAVTGPPDEAPQSAASIAVLKKCGFEFWKEQKESDSLGPEKSEKMLPVWRLWAPGYSSSGH